jgi:hypothetical protein
VAVLRDVGFICQEIIPERRRWWKGNREGVLKHPLAITATTPGNYLILDVGKDQVLIADSHYPANVSVIVRGLVGAEGLAFVTGAAFITVPASSSILYLDVAGCRLSPAKMLKPDLVLELNSRGLDSVGLRAVLVARLLDWMEQNSEEEVSSGREQKGVEEPEDVEPWLRRKSKSGRIKQKPLFRLQLDEKIPFPRSLAVNTAADILYVSSWHESASSPAIFAVTVSSNGVGLRGVVKKICALPRGVEVHGLAFSPPSTLFFTSQLGEHSTVYSVPLPSGLPTIFSQPNELLLSAHGIAVGCGAVKVFVTDKTSRRVLAISADGAVSSFAGTGDAGRDEGSVAHAQFSQPTGLCSDHGTLLVCDSANASVRLISSVHGLADFLEHVNRFVKAFGVHRPREQPEVLTISDAIVVVDQTYQYLQSMVTAARERSGKALQRPQGPDGTVGYRTIQSVLYVLEALQGTRDALSAINPDYLDKIKVRGTAEIDPFQPSHLLLSLVRLLI